MDIFKKAWFWIIVVAVVVAGAIVALNLEQEEVAVRVNETTFSQAEFDSMVDQVVQEYQMYGMQVDDEEAKDQAIDRAIQEALLIELAEEEGFEASEEEIQEEFDQIMMMYGAQSEEEFMTQLEAEGFEDREEIDDLLAMEVQINKLVDLYGEDIEISDEEVREAYDQYAAQIIESGQEAPEFEEMEAEIRESLIQEEVNALLLNKIAEMEEEADIEVNVDQEDVEIEEEVEQEMPGEEGEPMEIEIDADDMEDGELEVDPEELE